MAKFRGFIRMKWRNILSGLISAVLVLVILLLVLVSYGSVPNKWYQVLAVTSGSMAPAIQAGDAIVIKRPPPFEELQEGTIVTFVIQGNIVTHRIKEVHEEGFLVTKGDANEGIDHFYDSNGDPYYPASVSGVYAFKIPYLGYLLKAPELIAHATSGWLSDAETVGSLSAGVSTFTPTATPIPTDTPTPKPTATDIPDTDTPEPTATDVPDTNTPEPTATAEPMEESTPTDTAEPETSQESQNTPAPTEETSSSEGG